MQYASGMKTTTIEFMGYEIYIHKHNDGIVDYNICKKGECVDTAESTGVFYEFEAAKNQAIEDIKIISANH